MCVDSTIVDLQKNTWERIIFVYFESPLLKINKLLTATNDKQDLYADMQPIGIILGEALQDNDRTNKQICSNFALLKKWHP